MLALDVQEILGIGDCSADFQAIANDTGVFEQGFYLHFVIFSDQPGIKIVECLAIVIPLAKDGDPSEAGLRSLED